MFEEWELVHRRSRIFKPLSRSAILETISTLKQWFGDGGCSFDEHHWTVEEQTEEDFVNRSLIWRLKRGRQRVFGSNNNLDVMSRSAILGYVGWKVIPSSHTKPTRSQRRWVEVYLHRGSVKGIIERVNWSAVRSTFAVNSLTILFHRRKEVTFV